MSEEEDVVKEEAGDSRESERRSRIAWLAVITFALLWSNPGVVQAKRTANVKALVA